MLLLWAVAGAQMPPPPMSLDAATQQAVLYLDLSINGLRVGEVVRVVQDREGLRVRASDLLSVGVSLPVSSEDGELALSSIPDLAYQYNPNALVLEITVPPQWFEQQRIGEKARVTMAARSDRGFLVNYAANVMDASQYGRIASLWSELRSFGRYGVFTHSGINRHTSTDNESISRHFRDRSYVRFDTAWSTVDESAMRTWTVGDLISAGQNWSAPVRVAGFKVSRDFRLRPDLITYPLPQFAGETAIPTTLDLIINGQRVRSEELRPGPYTVTGTPYMTGAGEATLRTTDVVGQPIITTVPFYVSSELLRDGLSDYAISVGSLRRAFGLENFAYAGLAGAGSYRYGLSDVATIETHVELASIPSGTFHLAGVGGLRKLGTLGVANGSVSHSAHAEGSGLQYTFGYRYSRRMFNIGYQGTRVTRDFHSLATLDNDSRTTHSANSDVITAGMSWGSFGSFGASYFRVQPRNREASRFVNLSYSRQVAGTVSLSVHASRDLLSGENMAAAQLTASFGRRGNVRVGTQQGGAAREQIQYSRAAPSHGGLSWNVGHVRDERDFRYTDANLGWSTRYARAEAGISSNAHNDVRWMDVRGSVLAMGGGVFPSRHISDSFVVVSADGLSDVPVRYENQLVGRTDRRGRLLVPSVSSHYPGKFAINPLELPAEVSFDEIEQRVVVKRRSGAFLNFPVTRTRGALLKLVDADGAVLPMGSGVLEKHTAALSTVGYDGLVYFENLDAQIALQVHLPGGGTCRVAAPLPSATGAVTPVGPLTCERLP